MSSRRKPISNSHNEFGSWNTEPDHFEEKLAQATNGLREVIRHINEYDRFELEELYMHVRQAERGLAQKLGYMNAKSVKR